MRCFNHAEDRAVGICKNCGKGICHACLTDLGHGLACSATCEERIQGLHQYNNKVVKYNTSAFCFGIGILFTGFGIYSAFKYTWNEALVFSSILGLLFIFMGWKQVKLTKNKRIGQK